MHSNMSIQFPNECHFFEHNPLNIEQSGMRLSNITRITSRNVLAGIIGRVWAWIPLEIHALLYGLPPLCPCTAP